MYSVRAVVIVNAKNTLKNAKPESIEVCFKRKCAIAFLKVTLLFMIIHRLLVPRQPKISWAKKELKTANFQLLEYLHGLPIL